MDDNRTESAPSYWLRHRLTEKSTWSGMSLVVICALVLLGLPIVKTLAWFGLLYGLYSMFSKD
ncbi:hypothetical protein [Methylocaldum sp.]|uniref:hypothetical protein n=1 Tax=Methylocaldum sp. TaxID=1969727 RepID=UPI002D3317D6|nr:hypothetical protein [Methylocaldum sp.]HYE37260.1 hypothetical protein [Methylocaldum sp.]